MLAMCVVSAACAAALAVLLFGVRADEPWPQWKLWLCTLLLVPGQVLPLPLLWGAWRHMYFLIPFIGPPIRVGMPAVWCAVLAVVLSYTPAVLRAWRRQWSWQMVLLHPYGVVLLLCRAWTRVSRRAL